MSETKLDRDKLPWIYRVILRLPKIGLESVLGDLQGVYWAIVVPLFLVCEFFLSLFLLLAFPSPINFVMICIIPAATFVIFVKVELERFMNWWNMTFPSRPMRWDVKKTTEEYVKLLQKQKSKRRKALRISLRKNRKED